ncbi:MAG: hypothetical protein HY336_00610 [Candidatus Doudnabacteria bacterium]|nr:hypothetical protein [Candidatus Doudnabacteria bacterium]
MILQTFSEIWQYFNIVLVNWFGWLFVLWVLIYMLFWLHRNQNQNKYIATFNWIFLEVRVEELNERSPLAMEQVFAALHAIHQNFTWGEKFNGKVLMWFSAELVSFGGKVSYIFKIPDKYKSLLESAIFAQYPKAEINEVEDYLKNMPKEYFPEEVDFDFWGTQLLKKKDNAYPIRTYGIFEHPEQKTFIDPLANVIEVLSNLQPYELMVYQIVCRPIDDKWKIAKKLLLDKLKGAPLKSGSNLFDKIFLDLPGNVLEGIVSIFSGPAEPQKEQKKDEPPSQMLHKTEGEKQVIASIEHALSKIYFEAKFRLFYMAPKDKFNKGLRLPEIIGAVRNFDDVALNGPKPDMKHTWTDKAYKLSEQLEKPYLQKNILTRKRHFWHAFTSRSFWKGSGDVYFNTEELATIYHFPQAPNVRVSQVERVTTVKSAPPPDLPVG